MGTPAASAVNVTGVAAPAVAVTSCCPAGPKRHQASGAVPFRRVVAAVDAMAPPPPATLNVTGTPSVAPPNWFSTDTVTFLEVPGESTLVVTVHLVHGGDDQGLGGGRKGDRGDRRALYGGCGGVCRAGAMRTPTVQRLLVLVVCTAPDTLPPPEATAKATCAPGTGNWPSVTTTEGATGSRLPCTQVWLFPATTESVDGGPVTALASMLTEMLPAVALSVLTPGAGPRVQSPTVAIPWAVVVVVPPVTEPPPARNSESDRHSLYRPVRW